MLHFSSFIIVVNSSWLISASASALDIIFYMLFNVLPANKTVSLCFVLFSSFWKVFFVILLLRENTKSRLVLFIPVNRPITLTNEAIETLSIAADKASKVLSTESNAATYLLSVVLIVSLSWISAIK